MASQKRGSILISLKGGRRACIMWIRSLPQEETVRIVWYLDTVQYQLPSSSAYLRGRARQILGRCKSHATVARVAPELDKTVISLV